jgi:hypothetical protein
MIYVLILSPIIALLFGGIIGYFFGRYQNNIIDKIRTLEEQGREKPLEPEKPIVTGGAYQPPKEFSTVPEPKRSAGLVETKTAKRMEWEQQQEIEALATKG